MTTVSMTETWQWRANTSQCTFHQHSSTSVLCISSQHHPPGTRASSTCCSPFSKSFSASSAGEQREDAAEHTGPNIWAGQQMKMYQQTLATLGMKSNYIIQS